MEKYNPLDGKDAPQLSLDLNDGSEDLVSIIIIHRNKPDYLNLCLQSIDVCSVNSNYELIIVDNGSGQESQDFLDEIESNVKLIRNKENLYWSEAANKGAKAANKAAKYIIFMHCDVVVLNPGWMDLLINVSAAKNAGMVGLELQNYFMQNQKVDFIQEWCLLMTRECWDEVGPFPEELPQIGHSFIMTMKAQQKGYNPQVMQNPICHHYRIFSLDINEYEKLTEKAMVSIPALMREMQAKSI